MSWHDGICCTGTVWWNGADRRENRYILSGSHNVSSCYGNESCEPPYEIRPIREIDPTLSGGLERIITKCTQPDQTTDIRAQLS